jgi:hypothetical protein
MTRLFAIEEAYVTIYEEYSPFFNAPAMPRSRKPGPNGWELGYDLALYDNPGDPARHLALWDRPGANPRGVLARWTDVYMSDLRWDRNPRTVSLDSSGLPHQSKVTIGFEGELSFNAPHFARTLVEMSGFNRYWRIFVDVKRDKWSPIEASFEFRGASVVKDGTSGSPIGLARAFAVQEFTEGDALYAVDPTFRFELAAYKQIPFGGQEQIPVEVLHVQQSHFGYTLNGQYPLSIALGTHYTLAKPTYKLTYNGHALDDIPWQVGREFRIDGYEAGVLTFRIMGAAPEPGALDVIRVEK